MKINRKGFVTYGFLIIFFLISFTAGGIMKEFLKSIKDENLHLNKEESRILAESGLEISMNKIYKRDSEGNYSIQNDLGEITIKIETQDEKNFHVESVGFYKESKTKVEAIIELKEDLYPELIERKMW